METQRITRLCKTQKCLLESQCHRKEDNIFDVVDRLQRTKRQVYGVYDKETQSCEDFVKKAAKKSIFSLNI